MVGIYRIVNRANGSSYIGGSSQVGTRLSKHRWMLTCGKHPNRNLQAAWNEYGADQFGFEILLVCSKDNLLFYEQRAIDSYKADDKIYNLTFIAGSQLGFKHSDETREKFRNCPQLRAGKVLSPKTRAAISAGLMGHSVSDKHRKSSSERFKGKSPSLESRAKMSLAKQGKKQSPDVIAKRSLSFAITIAKRNAARSVYP